MFTESEGTTVLKSENWNEKGFVFPKNEEERCTDPNCFSHFFTFSASNDQIEALVDQSVTCKQKIKHVCSTNGLTNLSSWTGRDRVEYTYWSGDRNTTDKGFVISSYLNSFETLFTNGNNQFKVVNAVLTVTALGRRIYTLNQYATVIQDSQKVLTKVSCHQRRPCQLWN